MNYDTLYEQAYRIAHVYVEQTGCTNVQDITEYICTIIHSDDYDWVYDACFDAVAAIKSNGLACIRNAE